MKKLNLILLFSLLSTFIFAQVTVEGYAYEENNRGFLNQVKITLFDANSKSILGKATTDEEGYFSFEVPSEQDYMVRGEKKVFKTTEVNFTSKGKQAGDKVFVKMEILRKPGYTFDVTLAERRPAPGVPVDAIKDSRIEVYNNTLKKEELVLDKHAPPNFNVNFEQGNHYTVMIRKKGFFTKRMEAYVNVEGCILCFDGVGDVRPGVADVMTKNNTMGTLLANVQLDRIEMNKSIKIENIYYDLGESDIREDASAELDKLLVTLKDNPALIVELGSHTDCRGKDRFNLDLSEKRANSAVAYLVDNGVDATRIKAKGYGETVLVNECDDGVRCSERRHQLNRRTELKIIGFLDDDPLDKLSLKEIIEEEQFQRMLEDVQGEGQIKVGEGEQIPSQILEEKKKKEAEEKKKKKKENLEEPISISNPNVVKPENKSKVKVNVPKVEKVEINSPSDKVVIEKPKVEMSVPSGNVVVEKPTTTPSSIPTPTQTKPDSKKIFSGNDIDKLAKADPSIVKASANPKSKIVNDSTVPVSTEAIRMKNLPATYSGFRVELLSSNAQLPGSHKIFTQHGDLTLEEKKDGTFAYLLGEFRDVKDAESFLTHIVLPRYPDAKVVQYKNGQRLVN